MPTGCIPYPADNCPVSNDLVPVSGDLVRFARRVR
jgi:hypothetical protein